MADAASSGDALSESWKRSNYGYRPSLGWGIAFSVCFGLIAVGHLVHVIRSRAIWLTLFAVGAILETIGWVGRTAAYTNPLSQSLFLMQIACLIMGKSYPTSVCPFAHREVGKLMPWLSYSRAFVDSGRNLHHSLGTRSAPRPTHNTILASSVPYHVLRSGRFMFNTPGNRWRLGRRCE